MKKLLSYVLIISLLVLSLSACGNTNLPIKMKVNSESITLTSLSFCERPFFGGEYDLYAIATFDFSSADFNWSWLHTDNNFDMTMDIYSRKNDTAGYRYVYLENDTGLFGTSADYNTRYGVFQSIVSFRYPLDGETFTLKIFVTQDKAHGGKTDVYTFTGKVEDYLEPYVHGEMIWQTYYLS